MRIIVVVAWFIVVVAGWGAEIASFELDVEV
jgi:hypothetical protein